MGSTDKLFFSTRRDRARDGGRREIERDLEMPTFKPISREPSAFDGATIWRKYYSVVEGQLRLWYQQKNSAEAPEQTMAKWDLIIPYIENLMMSSTKLFHIDTSYYIKNELDVRLWKYGIYQFIVLLRNLPSDSKYKLVVIQAYKDIYDRGLNYFKDLLVNVPKVLKIDLQPVLSRSSFLRQSKNEAGEGENLVYRLFIAMGDICRYAFEINKVPRDGKLAKDMYIAARYCDPEKPRAYNQLGVIFKSQNDIIGTIYNYTRAWSAPNSAVGAREQLLCLYDEIYKKYNLVRKEYWYSMSKDTEENLTRSRQSKFEMWIPPRSNLICSLPNSLQVPPSKKDYFNNLSFEETLNKFSVALGHFIGMLFTKIGTEALEDVAKEVIVCFGGLLLTPNSVKFSFVMEVLGLLLFMTDYLTPPAGSTDMGAIGQIKYMREEAVKVTLGILIILSEKMHQVITLLDWNNSILTTCSAALHVWVRWARRRHFICSDLLQQRKLFKRSPRRGDVEKKEAMYQFLLITQPLYALLTPLLKRHAYILFPKINYGTSNEYNRSLGVLPEQLVLEKFGDILSLQDFDTLLYRHNGGLFALEKAHLHFRLARIQKFFCKIFGEYTDQTLVHNSNDTSATPLNCVDNLVGNELHLLKFIHESIDMPIRKREMGKAHNFARPDCNNARIVLRKTIDTSTDKKTKRKTSEMLQMPMSKTYELWSDLCIRGVRTEVVIEPLDVVLDTNCLIRQLDWIDCLLHLLPRPIIIPSTVLLELRGLMKGAKTGEPAKPSEKDLSPDKHQERMIEIMEIGQQCIRALEYINEHKRFFRLITLCGREYKMYNYMKQKVFERRLDLRARNDEKILETCLKMEARNSKLRALDTPFKIFRNTMLLTGDRSLRVRAFAQDIPSRDIQSFTKWLINSRAVLPSSAFAGTRNSRNPQIKA